MPFSTTTILKPGNCSTTTAAYLSIKQNGSDIMKKIIWTVT